MRVFLNVVVVVVDVDGIVSEIVVLLSDSHLNAMKANAFSSLLG